jgi:hypothetical protein
MNKLTLVLMLMGSLLAGCVAYEVPGRGYGGNHDGREYHREGDSDRRDFHRQGDAERNEHERNDEGNGEGNRDGNRHDNSHDNRQRD